MKLYYNFLLILEIKHIEKLGYLAIVYYKF